MDNNDWQYKRNTIPNWWRCSEMTSFGKSTVTTNIWLNRRTWYRRRGIKLRHKKTLSLSERQMNIDWTSYKSNSSIIFFKSNFFTLAPTTPPPTLTKTPYLTAVSRFRTCPSPPPPPSYLTTPSFSSSICLSFPSWSLSLSFSLSVSVINGSGWGGWFLFVFFRRGSQLHGLLY